MTRLYLYGIADAGTELAPVFGLDDQPVMALSSHGLRLLCSPIGAEPVMRTRRNLLRHTQVLEHAQREAGVLPLRFGTVAPDEAAAVECLRANRAAFAQALGELADKVELGVKASWFAGGGSAAVLRANPSIRAARDRLRARPEAETYYERIELGRQVEAALAALRVSEAEAMAAPLIALATRHVTLKPQDEDMIFNMAFLVPKAREPAFDAAVDALVTRHQVVVAFRYLGPVPPFNFVDLHADWTARGKAA